MLSELTAELSRLGIRLEADGDKLRYWPRSAATAEVVGQLKNHKDELLAMLRHPVVAPDLNVEDSAAVWHSALNELEGDALFPPEITGALRNCEASWGSDEVDPSDETDPSHFGEDGWPVNTIDANDVNPCEQCKRFELWQSATGVWRCLHCDPPTTSRRLRERAKRLRERTDRHLRRRH